MAENGLDQQALASVACTPALQQRGMVGRIDVGVVGLEGIVGPP